MNEKPAFFKIEELGWDFELSYTSEDDTGKYELKLNNCRVEKLEKAQGYGREVPPLSKSTVLSVENDTLKSVYFLTLTSRLTISLCCIGE